MTRILSPESFGEGESVGGMTGSKKVKAKRSNIDGIDEGVEFQLKSSILTVDALDVIYKKLIKSKSDFLQEENPYDPKSPFNKQQIQKDFDKEQKVKGFNTRILTDEEIEKRKDVIIKNINSAGLSGLGRKVKSGGYDNELFSEAIASIGINS